MNKISVSIKSVYGNELIYPACDIAKAFCDLLNQITLTRSDISKIKAIGFEVIVKAKETKL